MKKLFLSIILFVATAINFSVFSQNLEFNAALLINSVEDTVPAGKVWKITGVVPSTRITSASCGTNYTSSSTSQIVKINGLNGYWGSSDSQSKDWSASASSMYLTDDIWLPAGTTLQASTGVLYISVLEFNIVP